MESKGAGAENCLFFILVGYRISSCRLSLDLVHCDPCPLGRVGGGGSRRRDGWGDTQSGGELALVCFCVCIYKMKYDWVKRRNPLDSVLNPCGRHTLAKSTEDARWLVLTRHEKAREG